MDTNALYGCFNTAPGAIDIPATGTLSKTIFQNDTQKVVLFAFAAGEELSEHTAAVPAIMHLVSGRVTWIIGGEKHEVAPGEWAAMTPKLPHTVIAHEPSVMVLILIKGAK